MVDQIGFPLEFIVTSEEVADCTQPQALMDRVKVIEDVEFWLADKGYDSDSIVDYAQKKDGRFASLKNQIEYDLETMTELFTKRGIWSKTSSFSLKNGEV